MWWEMLHGRNDVRRHQRRFVPQRQSAQGTLLSPGELILGYIRILLRIAMPPARHSRPLLSIDSA